MNENYYDERYTLVEPACNTYLGSDEVCYKIIQFLLDFPYLKSDGTMSEVHSNGSRADLIKYLFYDDGNPLSHKLPTVEDKKKLIFNPARPQKPPLSDKGYRILNQPKTIDVQTDSKVELRIYPLMITPKTPFVGDLLIAFECWSNMDYLQIANFQNRPYNMAMCVLSALCGRNLTGVGGLYFDRQNNMNCTLSAVTDNRYNSGYRLIMGVNIASGTNH